MQTAEATRGKNDKDATARLRDGNRKPGTSNQDPGTAGAREGAGEQTRGSQTQRTQKKSEIQNNEAAQRYTQDILSE